MNCTADEIKHIAFSIYCQLKALKPDFVKAWNVRSFRSDTNSFGTGSLLILSELPLFIGTITIILKSNDRYIIQLNGDNPVSSNVINHCVNDVHPDKIIHIIQTELYK